jgi:hypothetical protein
VGGNGNGQADPHVAASCDVAGGGKPGECFTEALVADVEGRPEGLATAAIASGAVKRGEYRGVDIVGDRGRERLIANDGQMQVVFGAEEGKGGGLGSAGGAVLDGQDELLALTTQGERGVDPGEEVTGSAQVLAAGGAAVLARVVDDGEGQVVGALQLAQISEDGGDIAGLILVNAMEPHEGVEQEEPGSMAPDGLREAALVAWLIEAHAGRGDHADGKCGEIERSVAADAKEPLLDDRSGVLGHVDEHATGLTDGERVEARCATGDGNGEVEPEPALVALGRTADDADAGASPEVFDEPAARRVRFVEGGGIDDRQYGLVGSHPVTIWAAGEASMAASMVWSSMKV